MLNCQWHDKDSSTSEGMSVESITLQLGLQQIIVESTHILENSSSYVDLTFTSQPNLLNLLYYEYWTDKQKYLYANLLVESGTDSGALSISESDWNRAFANKQVDEKVFIFNKTILNILSNFIQHEVIVCDDKDGSMEKLNR